MKTITILIILLVLFVGGQEGTGWEIILDQDAQEESEIIDFSDSGVGCIDDCLEPLSAIDRAIGKYEELAREPLWPESGAMALEEE